MHQSEQLLKHVLQVTSYTAPIHKAKGHLQTQPGGKVPALPSSHAHVFTRGRGGEGSHPNADTAQDKQDRMEGERRAGEWANRG